MKNSKKIMVIAILFLFSCSSGHSSTASESTSQDTLSSFSSNISLTTEENSIESSSSTSENNTSSSQGISSICESSSSTSELASSESSSIETKYKVIFVENANVRYSLIGSQEEFAKDEQVSFSYSPVYGYKVTSFTILDENSNSVNFSETSYVTFLMPESDVTISFIAEARKTLTIDNDEHSYVNIINQEDYYDEGDRVDFTLSFDDGFELNEIKVIDEHNITSAKVDYSEENGQYSFSFVDANMKIEVSSKEKIVSQDPFTTPATFEGNWDYFDGYYSYVMRLRIVFNGNYTLSWYLTYESIDDEWDSGYEAFIPTKNAKPSDMIGDIRESKENIRYKFDETLDQILFDTTVGMSSKSCVLLLTRDSNKSITSIKMQDNMGSGYYQTGGRVLLKK